MSPQPIRGPKLALVVALACVVALVLAALAALSALSGYLVVRSVGGAPQQPRTTAVSTGLDAVSVQLASLDVGGADYAHELWVAAVLIGDLSDAEAVFAAESAEQRRNRVDNLIAMTEMTLNLTEAKGDLGRYLQRHEVVGSQPGDDAVHRTGLARLLFEHGSLCFATEISSTSGVWLVEEWHPVSVTRCDELAASGPSQLDVFNESNTDVQRVHFGWVNSVLGDDKQFAALFFAGVDDPQQLEKVNAYVELTGSVIDTVRRGPEGYGLFKVSRVFGPYEISPTEQVGLSQVVFERGSLCFRADLSITQGEWRVTKWNQVELTECVSIVASANQES